MDCEKA
jgi:hypothetical protein